jgi:excisionase family DNA binding protein
MSDLERVFSPDVAAILEAEIDRRVQAALDGAQSPYMTPDEAAAYIGAERQRVYDLCSDGRLRRYRDGSRLLVRRDELDAYLAHGGRR